MHKDNQIIWRDDLSAAEWDGYLAAAHGHPLQSALWGDARAKVDGIEDHRWAAFSGDELVWMGRFEVRRIPMLGKVAWMPRGPAPFSHPLSKSAHIAFHQRLKAAGYLLCVDDQYPASDDYSIGGVQGFKKTTTLWLDLSVGKDQLLNSINRNLRYEINRAKRESIEVYEGRSPDEIEAFFEIYSEISQTKGFGLRGSKDLMNSLIETSGKTCVEARLFVAHVKEKICGGYLVMHNGWSLHNIWSAVARSSGLRYIGPAMQWAVLEWAMEKGLLLYDQEGIDFVQNPGCYAFKKKLGGHEVELPGKYIHPLKPIGKAALQIGRWLKRI